MVDDKQKVDRPMWVELGLLGIPGRNSAWAFFWISIAAAVGCCAYGFRDHRFFWGVGFVFAALWYWLCIRWMDTHQQWP